VTIAIERDVDRGVAHAGLNCFRVSPGRDGERDTGVTQIVEAARDSSTMLRGGEVLVPETCSRDRLPSCVRKDQAVTTRLGDPLEMLGEDVGGDR
jgi:hypothetical protein